MRDALSAEHSGPIPGPLGVVALPNGSSVSGHDVGARRAESRRWVVGRERGKPVFSRSPLILALQVHTVHAGKYECMSTAGQRPATSEASDLASKGGRARAKSLTAEKRSEIARAAVEARWARAGKAPLPRATNTGQLTIGEIEFGCAVLNDGTRLISETRFMEAMGMYRSGALSVRRKTESRAGSVPLFLAQKNLRPFAEEHLGSDDFSLVRYVTPTGSVANGIRAEMIPKVCEVWLDAERAGVLGRHQLTVARRADILLRGLAHTGIVALVDEATGYQDVRAKDALAKILEAFVSQELRKYLKTFPVDYYKQMYRLNGWEWNVAAVEGKRPQVIGRWTNDIIYDRMAPGLRDELHRLTPRDERGKLKSKLFQRLNDELGTSKLSEHLGAVVALMKAADDWNQFIKMLDRAFPAFGSMLPLPMSLPRSRTSS